MERKGIKTGERKQWYIPGGGGRGLAVSYTSLNVNQREGMMDCYYVDVVGMQTRTVSRRCCASVPGSRQMNTGRQSGTGRIKSSEWERWVKKLDKEQLSQQSTACPGRRPLHQSAMLVVLLESGFCSATGPRRREGGEAAGKHQCQVKKNCVLHQLFYQWSPE